MSSTRRSAGYWLGLLALFVGLVWVSQAAATTALKFDLESLVANSNKIVLGDVTEVRSFREEGRIYTETTVEVVESWKGDRTTSITIRHPGGRVGDTVTRVFGLPGFEPKERVVLFLRRAVSASGETREQPARYTVTGLRQGKFHVALGPDASTEFVVPRLGDMQLLEPKDGGLFEEGESADAEGTPVRKLKKFDATKLRNAKPAPIHEQVMALDEFRTRVRKAVDVRPSEGGEQ